MVFLRKNLKTRNNKPKQINLIEVDTMDTIVARKYYQDYAPSVAYVEVQNSKGDIEIGSAFHIGEGVFISARHVLNSFKIKSIATTINWYINSEEGMLSLKSFAGPIEIKAGPFFHPDEKIDLACFVANRVDFPSVPIGTHLDDWIGDDMILHSSLVLGYPPIPFSDRPVLVTTISRITAVIDKYTASHPHFILSSMARGGFSGGLPLSEYGFALGVIVESLVKDNHPLELGYLSVISVEPIYTLLNHYNIMPKDIRDEWNMHDGTNLWDQ